MMLVDSHCHLDYPDFNEEGITEIVTRAGAVGVGHMLTICTRMSEFDQVRAVAEQFGNIDCTVGTHPHHAAEEAEMKFTTADIISYTQDDKVVGIGETGLDYYYNHAPRKEQIENFEKHIEACLETDLPVIVHTRDADEDTLDILKSAGKGKLRGVLHCFSSSQWLAEQALNIGFYISFSGIVTFNKAEDLRNTAKIVPMDRLLVETDSPYLAPVPKRGKRNEPSFVVHTAQKVAELKDIGMDDLAKTTTENFFTLFSKAKRKTG